MEKLPPSSSVLKTERLIFRPIQEGDFPPTFALFNDSEVAKTMAGTRSASQVSQFLENDLKEWKEKGWGIFLFFTPENTFVGRAGLRQLTIDGEEVVELQYALMPAFWRQGYATEIGHTCLNWAKTHTTLKQLVCFTLPSNTGSLKVMKKLGFVYEKEITHAGLPHVLYRKLL